MSEINSSIIFVDEIEDQLFEVFQEMDNYVKERGLPILNKPLSKFAFVNLCLSTKGT